MATTTESRSSAERPLRAGTDGCLPAPHEAVAAATADGLLARPREAAG